MKGIGLPYALRGLCAAVRRERNLRIELVAACYALAGAWAGETEPWAKGAVLLCCMLVLSLELGNSALETLGDRVSKEQDAAVGRAKDVAAGAVLCAAIGSLGLAALVFENAEIWDKLTRPAVWIPSLAALFPAVLFIRGRKKWRERKR